MTVASMHGNAARDALGRAVARAGIENDDESVLRRKSQTSGGSREGCAGETGGFPRESELWRR